jgi:hypothetical protein
MSIKPTQERSPDVQPDILFFPQPQPTPAGARRRVAWAQVTPAGTGFEEPENAFENTPVVGPWPSGTASLGEQRLDEPPLIITEKCLGRCQLFITPLELCRNYFTSPEKLMKPLLAIYILMARNTIILTIVYNITHTEDATIHIFKKSCASHFPNNGIFQPSAFDQLPLARASVRPPKIGHEFRPGSRAPHHAAPIAFEKNRITNLNLSAQT